MIRFTAFLLLAFGSLQFWIPALEMAAGVLP
jgi:hypothetical protein